MRCTFGYMMYLNSVHTQAKTKTTRLRMNQTQPAILKWFLSWPYGKSFSRADTAPVPITTANHAGVKCLVAVTVRQFVH